MSQSKVKLIAHRGNVNGREPERENHPDYIREALNAGFDVEVDVWRVPSGCSGWDSWFLGHDEPQYDISGNFLLTPGLWCHAKNAAALAQMMMAATINCFAHHADPQALTSDGHIWAFPGCCPSRLSVWIFGEEDSPYIPSFPIAGICCDTVGELKCST